VVKKGILVLIAFLRGSFSSPSSDGGGVKVFLNMVALHAPFRSDKVAVIFYFIRTREYD
jgi:hypothetical protein